MSKTIKYKFEEHGTHYFELDFGNVFQSTDSIQRLIDDVKDKSKYLRSADELLFSIKFTNYREFIELLEEVKVLMNGEKNATTLG